MTSQYIPPATAEKLAQDAPKGSRHNMAKDIALSLVGNGMPESSVFATLRAKFPADVTDKELSDIVAWSVRQNPAPSIPSQPLTRYIRRCPIPQTSEPKRTPIEQADWWTSGLQLSIEDMAARSPVCIPPQRAEACALALASLYKESEHLNIVCRYMMDGEKTRPTGAGKTLKRDEWLAFVRTKGVPQNMAGAWLRLNPCGAVGSGKEGAVTDADIINPRYLLVESDVLPVNRQVALLSKWNLPIAAVVSSGGHSVHAWIKIEATPDKYRELATQLLETLKPFGYDIANKNLSRLCRLPGAIRTIGATDGGEQKLIWLNPDVPPLTEERLRVFRESLQFPAVLEKPLVPIAQQAVERYEWMMANVGKLGVPSGIPKLDAISGGWKKGQTTVVAGATGGGKTTLALHCILAALKADIGVLLFSLEMDRDEIFDLLVSSKCRINRNKFNNGRFTEYDLQIMGQAMPAISKMPLYIEDSALSTPEQVRLRALQLKADNKIGLIVVDYIQFVNPGWNADNREQQVASISHSLRALTREIQLPMIVLSQLNDQGMLRESRVIAHNANIVMLVEVSDNRVQVKIVKGRGVPLGDYAFTFDRDFATLIPIDLEDEPPEQKPVMNDP